VDKEFEPLDWTPLRDALKSREVPDWHKPVLGRYHASQLPYCLMKQYITFKLADSAETPYVGGQSPEMWIGSLIHEAIERDVMPKVTHLFTPVVSEHEIYYGLGEGCEDGMIVGKVDHLVQFPDGSLAVIDVKSVGTLKWVRQNGLREVRQYVTQLAFYQGALNVHRGYLWFIAYRDGALQEALVPCPFRERYFEEILDRARLLHTSLKTSSPPPAVPAYSWECIYRNGRYRCPFLDGPCPRRSATVEEKYVTKNGTSASKLVWTSYLPEGAKLEL